jgi:hypothetical protein
VRAGGAVQADERPTRPAHQDVEGREIPYRYLRLGGDVGRAFGHQAIGQEVAVGALRTAGGMLANPWLFPSRRPGKHLDAISLVIGLGNAGINVLGARNSALRNLVAEMPPPVVANLLGYSHSCTQRHAQLAVQPWSRTSRSGCEPTIEGQ